MEERTQADAMNELRIEALRKLGTAEEALTASRAENARLRDAINEVLRDSGIIDQRTARILRDALGGTSEHD